MVNDETFKKIAAEFASIREEWIKYSIRCNIDESYVILDFQKFVEDNNIQLVFNVRTGYSELRMNNEIIGKFNESPAIIEENGTFRFNAELWTRNAKELG